MAQRGFGRGQGLVLLGVFPWSQGKGGGVRVAQDPPGPAGHCGRPGLGQLLAHVRHPPPSWLRLSPPPTKNRQNPPPLQCKHMQKPCPPPPQAGSTQWAPQNPAHTAHACTPPTAVGQALAGEGTAGREPLHHQLRGPPAAGWQRAPWRSGCTLGRGLQAAGKGWVLGRAQAPLPVP